MDNLKILVVEDEAVVAMSIISQLENNNYKVIGDVSDGVKAIEFCKDNRPDLVIMDINLPRLNGIETAKIIKSKFDIPVVILSGYSNEELIKNAAEAGVFNYITKPITGEELRPAIEIAMKNYKNYTKMRHKSENLERALEERKVIERAKGILMNKNQLTEEKAMKKMQKVSNNKNKKMIEIAKEIINAADFF